MDEQNSFAKTENHLDNQVNTRRIFSNFMKMDFFLSQREENLFGKKALQCQMVA